MSSISARERPTGLRLAMPHNKNGFITVYALILLSVTFGICTMLNQVYRDKLRFIENIDEFRLINQIEVLAIARARNNYDEYRLKDELISYQSCSIRISYDGERASINISCPKFSRQRIMRYDEIERFVTDYY